MGKKKHRKHIIEAMESKIVGYHSWYGNGYANHYANTFKEQGGLNILVIFKQLIESPREA